MYFGPVESRRGETTCGTIVAAFTMGRFPVEIPVVVVEALKDGPTLVVSGCVHGAELIGAMGINEFLRTVKATDLARGRIVFVPVANQSAFEFGIRNTQWDGMNLNRHGLGKPDGAITERIAYHFTHDVVLKADAFVDIHSGNGEGFVWYTISHRDFEDVIPEVRKMSDKMAVAFGLRDVMGQTPKRWAGGYMADVMRAGIPSIVVEIGGGTDYFINGKQQIEMCAQGIRNVAILMEIMQGDIVVESENVTFWAGDGEIINGSQGGLLRTDVQIGDHLEKGSLWGVLYNPFTADEVERFYTPHDCYQLPSLYPWPAVKPGAALATLGNKMEPGTTSARSFLGDLRVHTGRVYKTRRD